MRIKHLLVGFVASGILAAVPAAALAQGARELYERAVAKDDAIRATVSGGDRTPALREFRSVVASYELVVRRWPKSGYCDNALYKGAALARLASERFGDIRDKRTAARLLKQLVAHYPTSSLVAGSRTELARLDPQQQLASPAPQSPATLGAAPPAAPPVPPSPPASAPAAGATNQAAVGDAVVLRSITRSVLPNTVRISLELDREILFDQARLDNPARVFVDLRGTTPAAKLVDAVFTYSDDLVKQVRVGRHPGRTTRVVVDAEGISRYSIFTLYQPFRLVIDCERTATAAPVPAPMPPPPPPPPALLTARALRALDAPQRGLPRLTAAAIEFDAEEPAKPAEPVEPPAPIPARAAAPVSSTRAPSGMAANGRGGYSLARQLGLGVSRIVIDPGHGGRDPGAKIKGLTEADVVLDIALRLAKLLEKEPGVEVVLTRKKNTFIPLEERTAIANRENADLFLSIHVNANASPNVNGIETFFLNFATNAEAAAVASFENRGSAQAMHNLNDIVKAIALNNKLDESRDLATIVQDSMIRKVRPTNRNVRDLGVKQAPFVVLIGASMPSILAEVSHITHRQEAQFLKTVTYRQKLAEALFDGIRRYQRALKSAQTTAPQ